MCRLAAIAPIRPLPWEPPYAVGVWPYKAKKKKKKRERERETIGVDSKVIFRRILKLIITIF